MGSAVNGPLFTTAVPSKNSSDTNSAQTGTPQPGPDSATPKTGSMGPNAAVGSHGAASPPPPYNTRNRRNSQGTFANVDQTILVLDWDDTLFPTTWVRHYMGLHWRYPLEDQPVNAVQKTKIKQALDELSCEVEEFLRLALTKGRVVIVTLAKIPWVQLSCDNFFPRIAKVIKENDIRIVYAQEAQFAESKLPSPSPDAASQEAYWTRKKQLAIRAEVEHFYSQYPGQSWKNMISIGDSDFERKATIATMTSYGSPNGTEQQLSPSRSSSTRVKTDSSENLESPNVSPLGSGAAIAGIVGTPGKDDDCDMMCLSGTVGNHYRRLRTKTVKMYDSPRIKDLELEIQLLKKWLPSLISLDSGLDVDLEDDERLADTHRLLTGELL